jgi:hypothetical protein
MSVIGCGRMMIVIDFRDHYHRLNSCSCFDCSFSMIVPFVVPCEVKLS